MGKYMNDVQAFMQRHKHYIIYFYISINRIIRIFSQSVKFV